MEVMEMIQKQAQAQEQEAKEFVKETAIQVFMNRLVNGDGRSYKGIDRSEKGLEPWFEADLEDAVRRAIRKYSPQEISYFSDEVIPLMSNLEGRREQDRFLRSFMSVCENLGNEPTMIVGIMGHLAVHCQNPEEWPKRTVEAIARVKKAQLFLKLNQPE